MALLVVVFSMYVSVIGIMNIIPPGSFDAVAEAQAAEGNLTLRYLEAPPGFHTETEVNFYDQRYVREYSNSGNIFPGELSASGSRSDLLKVTIVSRLVAAKSGSATQPLPWVLTSRGEGQLASYARVEDSGKVMQATCGTSYISGRVPDNAVRVRATGPDPERLSFGYMTAHPPMFDVEALMAGKSVSLPDWSGSADQAVFNNSSVKGDTTAYAGSVCPGEEVSNAEKPDVPSCQPQEVASLPDTDSEDAAVAKALGSPAPTTTISTCATLTSIKLGGATGELRIGAAFNVSSVHNSASGQYAVHLPRISVLAEDANGNARLQPLQVRVFAGELLGDTSGKLDKAPADPVVPVARARYIALATPPLTSSCQDAPSCKDGPQLLSWSSTSAPLEISLAGENPAIAQRYQHYKDVGTIELPIGLALLIPAGAFILRPRAAQ